MYEFSKYKKKKKYNQLTELIVYVSLERYISIYKIIPNNKNYLSKNHKLFTHSRSQEFFHKTVSKR